MDNLYYQKYLKYKNKYLKIKKTQKGGGDKKTIFLFKADWCSHCKNFLPVWEELEKNNNSNFKFVKYDNDKNPEEIKKWNIEGFTTIMVETNESAFEYMGPRTYNEVLDFINNV